METNNTKRRALGRGLEELFFNEPIAYDKVEENLNVQKEKTYNDMRTNIGNLAKGVLLEKMAKNPTASIRQLLNDIATSNPGLPIYDEKTMKRNVGNLVKNMLREKGIAQGKEPKELFRQKDEL